ncbi:glucosylglycerol 3-phosphatase [Prochlorococcus marinus]|uniref:glucosylglycerol 3-phosphatase n=1 Tax=Prochlorococcus marinus TaxID=1219 RepID=UPI0022B4EC29|nr:glucosylglycerol 3-phosphatase [Prochlorococcus marinus]
MLIKEESDISFKKISTKKNILIIQDIDGVCIPLVKDPLLRKIDPNYIESIAKLDDEFAVLTCGEHEGERGVNRIIERALNSNNKIKEQGLYLPGLAACGVEYQDKHGNMELLGLSIEENKFLSEAPKYMKKLLEKELVNSIPFKDKEQANYEIKKAICDTRFSPAINLNSLFNIFENDLKSKIKLQEIMLRVMSEIIEIAYTKGFTDSFYLHISPNLGIKNGNEIIKFATKEDIGTTDIQLIIKGALKECGLLVLLNKYIKNKFGYYPFGHNFSIRNAPKGIDGLISLCKKKIRPEIMPILIGVGDTITSNKDILENKWLRGGSDRGFLTLIQELGKAYKKENIIIFVDSSFGEVYRPSTKDQTLTGITDPYDILKLNVIMNNGPKEYIKWVNKFCNNRYNMRKK